MQVIKFTRPLDSRLEHVSASTLDLLVTIYCKMSVVCFKTRCMHERRFALRTSAV